LGTGWEEAESAGFEPGMVALRNGEFVLALFHCKAVQGQVLAIGLSMPEKDMAALRARLPEDAEVSEDGGNGFSFRA
jgi:hypothetical protein